MRITVSGTHASGKSTLISDFRAERPRYVVLGDPFDEIDSELLDATGDASFAAQLRFTVSRLRETAREQHAIFERGPLDFLAYLTASERLGRSDGALIPRATRMVLEALPSMDLLAVLPLDDRWRITVPEEEDPALREAMNDSLLDLLDDLAHDGASPRVIMIAGDPQTRLRLLAEAAAD